MLFKKSISNSPNIKSRGVPLRISKLWITAASTILNHKTAIPQMTNYTNTQNVVPGGESPPPFESSKMQQVLLELPQRT